MVQESPLRKRQDEAGAVRLFFGDAEAGVGASVVDTFGELEAEYAAIRKGCVLIDQPQIATVRVTGADRHEFLNRMVTQELAGDSGLTHWRAVRSFWLNRKGRIEADLRLAEYPVSDSGETLIACDVLSAGPTVEQLRDFVFAEDIAFEDATAENHRLALHGPSACRLLSDVSSPAAAHANAPDVASLPRGGATIVRIADAEVRVERSDDTGEIGLHLCTRRDDALPVFDKLAQFARSEFGHHNDPSTDTYKLRHAGWAAYNVARIEGGTPVFRVDFGPTNLPAETGVLNDRVSFTKGCYLGQEVVARMHSLGKPKQVLVAFRCEGPGPDASVRDAGERMPFEGAAVWSAGDDAEDAKPIGAVTSSTVSPMLGNAVIGFAQVKHANSSAGTAISVQTPSGRRDAAIQSSLAFWGS